jgi:hypothetical protein
METVPDRWASRLEAATYWPAIACLLFLIVLAVSTPQRYRALSTEAGASIAALGVVLIIASLVARSFGYERVARWSLGVLIGLASAVVAFNFADLLRLLFSHDISVSGWSLLAACAMIYVANILTFSLWYWFLDRGGPDARTREPAQRPEWLFPEMTAAEYGGSVWRPVFGDYLFLALITSMAFSPTDTLPLATRSRILLGLQAVISLTTVGLLAARAVNLLQ